MNYCLLELGLSWSIDREDLESLLCTELYKELKNLDPNIINSTEEQLQQLWNFSMKEPNHLVKRGFHHMKQRAHHIETINSGK